jgi:hypothetical protein
VPQEAADAGGDPVALRPGVDDEGPLPGTAKDLRRAQPCSTAANHDAIPWCVSSMQ